jgi:aminoglycoside 6'-N-acetyltransferase I
MPVRRLEAADVPGWIELRRELWPHESLDDLGAQGRAALGADPPLVVLVAEEDSTLVGFLEVGLRSVAEGCSSSPVPYVEGWYVPADWRGRGSGARS